MIKEITNYLEQHPVILNFLRKFLEGGHKGEIEVIKRELPDRLERRALDLGCGTGVFSPFFGKDYAGVDISEAYINYARRRYNKTFKAMDARRLAFPGQSFDIVWVNGVLHHLDDASVRQILKEIKRVLKTGGRVIIMEDTPGVKFISKIVRSLDAGGYIRPAEGYRRLIREQFIIRKEYPLRTGVCDYQVFVINI
ncbi:MAG: class I SAM-dependent methyltransferase [bacterium]|nr:class I SAM-dependent methyltransferase [bacterium]